MSSKISDSLTAMFKKNDNNDNNERISVAVYPTQNGGNVDKEAKKCLYVFFRRGGKKSDWKWDGRQCFLAKLQRPSILELGNAHFVGFIAFRDDGADPYRLNLK